MQRRRSTHEPRCCETTAALEPLSLLLTLPPPHLNPPTPALVSLDRLPSFPFPTSPLPDSPPLPSPSPDGSSSAEKTHFLMSLLNQNAARLQTDVVRGPCMHVDSIANERALAYAKTKQTNSSLGLFFSCRPASLWPVKPFLLSSFLFLPYDVCL